MADELRFDGKVVIVTGAGGGLGRAHALLLGSRGAKVVVNDLGGGAFGEGKGSEAADRVVAQIREGGGEAVANYDSVEEGEAIVKSALEAFGRIDVVVNNAGILRDSSFHKMSHEDWDLIYRVHVYGSYKVTAAAWPHMREQGYGRIVMTASAAGIYGNFGQANYAMAKLGLVGLANTLALEGRKRGILVNTIAPIAASRLTETVIPKEVLEPLQPELVSPLVAWLAHERCEETGGLFEVGGGFFGKLRWERSEGKTFRVGREVSIEDVQGAFGEITSFERTEHPGNIAESMGPILANVQRGKSKGGNEFIDLDEALGYEFEPMHSSYDERDLALYALGVGAAGDPNDEGELQLVYELHGSGFRALPTYGVIPAVSAILEMGKQGKTAPGLKYGLDRVLHGEQYTKLERPLPPHAKLRHQLRIKDIWDKGKGAIVVIEAKSFDEDDDLLITNEIIMFVRGAGGWGGESGPGSDQNLPPDRPADASIEEKVPENQALLYRLSGDWNPLHADPGFAKAFGFERPILHGLCTFGYAGRHVIRSFAPSGDPRYFKSIKARFAKPVFPGETLITQMWKEADDRVVFCTKVKERDALVISNAAIELYAEIPKKIAKEPPKKTSRAAEMRAGDASAERAPLEPTSRDVFAAVDSYLADHPELSKQIGKVFQFRLSEPESIWTIDVKSDAPGASEGEAMTPECTLEISDANFMAMGKGEKDPQKMYFAGELKVSGDIMASQRLSFLQKIEPERVMAAMKARSGGAGAAAPPSEAAAPASGDVFLGVQAYVEAHPELVDEIGTRFAFRLSEPASVWTIDVKDAPGSVEPLEAPSPDVTLELSEANFMAMTKGEKDPQKMYFAGELKVSGNVMASQKLGFLQKIDPAWAAQKIAEKKAKGGAQGSAAAPAKPAKGREAAAPRIFEALEARLAQSPGIAEELGIRIALRLRGPEASYLVDLRQAPGSCGEGEAEAEITLSLSDEAL
ncbi:MAG: SDR family NAD(P)-dependent oxidoreductase, partial [Myxococcales bacterium]|nr:SDR family NAD(P)-dependent oxidoreductase [Myxococcales bacterium]